MSFAMLGTDCCCPYYTLLGLRLGLLPGLVLHPCLCLSGGTVGETRRSPRCRDGWGWLAGRAGDEVVLEASYPIPWTSTQNGLQPSLPLEKKHPKPVALNTA